ncbi:MAG: class II D-tagatose-bisphosphate aldolase, non-catalytic subunit [Kiritimatiellae bacterium]|nr:class II D-tagatose-bisphosphate aldolase, non-catalytic subunit [Kiritimatiellia bacterium]
MEEMVAAQKGGRACGFYSVCSAHRFVLEASVQEALADGTAVLIESTSNQVDQFGGYTGMTPAQFVTYVQGVAGALGLPMNRLVLGGDHLGPNRWQAEPAAAAMSKARDLVRACVRAGYTKIHIDTSMRCADDPGGAHAPLPVETAAARAAQLCRTAEDEHRAAGRSGRLIYVIGTEVPPPGGAKETLAAGVRPTRVPDAKRTLAATRRAFDQMGLESAWDRVVALVVQPGVEYGDEDVVPYNRARAAPLSRLIERHGSLVYEAHSTDYQTEDALRSMVQDHFAVLKVGPWLTFAFREAVFALAAMEQELLGRRKSAKSSAIRAVLEQVMLADPRHWQSYYRGTPEAQHYARQYSYSDRARYYWPHPRLQRALRRLIANLTATGIPLTLLSQHLPAQYAAIRLGAPAGGPAGLIHARIREVTGVYARACAMA